MHLSMPRRLSGFTPSGTLQLGNYLGAIRPTLDAQYGTDSMIFVADLHALTVEHQPARVRSASLETASLLVAAGADPARCTLFVQSQIPQAAELHYLLECATSYGEVHRMIQFKEKATGPGLTRLSLLTYPVLMAADILLYGIEEVLVGADQGQHVQLTRAVAARFNTRYGVTFTIPRAIHPQRAARVMDLSDPGRKMGKTNRGTAGVLFLLDPPDELRRKVMRAVTDSEREVRYDPEARPGVANLLEILAACVGDEPGILAGLFSTCQELKTAVADTVVATLAPIQERYVQLAAEPEVVREILAEGAGRASQRAEATLARVRDAVGLLSPAYV